ncbi:flagellar hook assembly protein FlgD [Magnetovibrio blakemorei]|uniref:Basal-body rod modification protein FlgD n=1 Tax=Magnetovibrio blakemorei TaxID=28181 RepID=A0A1E5Q9J1_9PROT|nr:flagellar hook assembly protein FlgD [Magnetovibrio blakemorei]OEJ68274.1 hypothetical protein BEN30_06600 [Magnetovibrio blakemorei]
MALFDSVGSSGVIDTSTQAGQSKAKLQEDLNQFLNLLVAQLQNQDPLDPLDANEFTSQLVQFASVEQQIQQNSNLEKMLTVQQNSQVASMVNYLGTVIEAKGQEFNMMNNQAMFTYTLDQNVRENTITISDASGKTMFTAEGSLDQGTHTVGWDGLKNDGTQAPDGAYKVTVSAKDGEGNLVDVQHTVFGLVTGTTIKDGNVKLNMGDVATDLTNIISVEMPVTTTTTIPDTTDTTDTPTDTTDTPTDTTDTPTDTTDTPTDTPA